MEASSERFPEGLQILLVILATVFVLEIIGSGSFNPSSHQLATFGGTSFLLIEQNKIFWLRAFTALFLHANLFHLLSNGIALLIGAPFLERIVGKYWLLTIFLYSGLIASMFSIFISPNNVVSIGASGGVMGIFSAALLITNKRIKPEFRKNLNLIFLQALIPSLIPFSPHVDYAAHFGGAIGGLILGSLVLCSWPMQEFKPQAEHTAKALVIMFMLTSVIAGYFTIIVQMA